MHKPFATCLQNDIKCKSSPDKQPWQGNNSAFSVHKKGGWERKREKEKERKDKISNEISTMCSFRIGSRADKVSIPP